jgi:membrane-associated phospholipid phosphatase
MTFRLSEKNRNHIIPQMKRLNRAVFLLTILSLGIVFIPVQIFDRPLFSFLNEQHSPTTDQFWLALTTLGDGLILVIILGAFLTVNPRVTVLGFVMLLVASVLTNTIKAIFPSLRPAEVMESVHVVGPLLRSGSFPSGHAAASMAAGLSIASFCSSRTAVAGALILAMLMSVSRIFVGAHFPKDVLGGVLLSMVIFYLLVSFGWPRWEEKVPRMPNYSSPRFRVAVGLEIVTALFALFVYAPIYAELSAFAALVSVAVLIFVAGQCYVGWKSANC